MANRDQILQPVFVRSFDQRDDVALRPARELPCHVTTADTFPVVTCPPADVVP